MQTAVAVAMVLIMSVLSVMFAASRMIGTLTAAVLQGGTAVVALASMSFCRAADPLADAPVVLSAWATLIVSVVALVMLVAVHHFTARPVPVRQPAPDRPRLLEDAR